MVGMNGVAPLLAFALFVIIGFHSLVPKGVESVGVCYGMVGNDLPPPTAVVKLYKSLGINRMRIYAPDTHVLGALRGSGIRLVLGVANEDLAANRASAASWLRANVKPYYPAVRVVVSESGWPSAGGFAASVENARAYNQGVVEHSGKGKGTPKRPGAALEAYVFAMFNENQKPGDPTEKSFGLFHPNKSAVSPIRFR